MGIQFQELLSWARTRKVFASLLVVLTLGVGIIIGTLVSGRAMATHEQAPSGASLSGHPRSRYALQRLFPASRRSSDQPS